MKNQHYSITTQVKLVFLNSHNQNENQCITTLLDTYFRNLCHLISFLNSLSQVNFSSLNLQDFQPRIKTQSVFPIGLYPIIQNNGSLLSIHYLNTPTRKYLLIKVMDYQDRKKGQHHPSKGSEISIVSKTVATLGLTQIMIRKSKQAMYYIYHLFFCYHIHIIFALHFCLHLLI